MKIRHTLKTATMVLVLGLLAAAFPGCRTGERKDVSNGAGRLQTVRSKLGTDMVLLPAGWFEMGSRRGSSDETPVHKVWIDSLLMDQVEVTQDLYRKMGLSDPSRFQGASLPVEQRTWIDAVRFCNVRSLQEGLDPCYNEETGECNFQANGYRLPTESEWEYACRAGTQDEYFFGNDPRLLKDYAWLSDNSGRKTHPVGTKKPNPWDLYDMYGNVAEWCHDFFAEDFYGKSPLENPRGPDRGELRVVRGGAWSSRLDSCRSSYRSGSASVNDDCQVSDAIGFRCVRKAPETKIMLRGEQYGLSVIRLAFLTDPRWPGFGKRA